MKNKKKKSSVRVIILYLILTTGLWMFLMSYSNSYNKLTTEKISPASIVVNKEKVEMTILEKKYEFDIDGIMPESKLYYGLYLAAPDELRLAELLIFLMD